MLAPRDTAFQEAGSGMTDFVYEVNNKTLCDALAEIYPDMVRAFADDEVLGGNTITFSQGETTVYPVRVEDVLFEMARRYYNLMERMSPNGMG